MSLDLLDYHKLSSLNNNTREMVQLLQQNNQNGALASQLMAQVQDLSAMLSQANEESRQLREALSNERASRIKAEKERVFWEKAEKNRFKDQCALVDDYNDLVHRKNDLAKNYAKLRSAYFRLKEGK